MINNNYRTGDLLLKNNIVTKDQLDYCLRQQQHLQYLGKKVFLGELIVKNRFASRSEVSTVISQTKSSFGLTPLNISYNTCVKFEIMPLGLEKNVAFVASVKQLTDKQKEDLIQELYEQGLKIEKIQERIQDSKTILEFLSSGSIATFEVINRKINTFNADNENGILLQSIFKDIISDAIDSRASDIHFKRTNEDFENWISFRIDSVRRSRYLFNSKSAGSFASKIKMEANLDIAESRKPQSGRFSIKVGQRNVDFRVEVTPMVNGEKITIRILDPDALKPLDFIFKSNEDLLKNIRKITSIKAKTGGIVLFTGPTGSGKSTTLYAMISEMDRLNLNIMTAEDPVEYQIAEVCQTAVNDTTGMTFANILRSFLRNDPDIIIVGEMRDGETAEIALRAAESGHMMISTLHTNDVSQSLNRLIGMLEEDYKPMGISVLAHNLKAIVNQRLIRTVCPHCKIDKKVKNLDLESIENAEKVGLNLEETIAIANPEGCSVCDHTGYYGRVLAPEAAFFPNDLNVQKKIEQIMSGSSDSLSSDILNLEGVEYYSRTYTTKLLLQKKMIDLVIASDLLELNFISKKQNEPENVEFG